MLRCWSVLQLKILFRWAWRYISWWSLELVFCCRFLLLCLNAKSKHLWRLCTFCLLSCYIIPWFVEWAKCMSFHWTKFLPCPSKIQPESTHNLYTSSCIYYDCIRLQARSCIFRTFVRSPHIMRIFYPCCLRRNCLVFNEFHWFVRIICFYWWCWDIIDLSITQRHSEGSLEKCFLASDGFRSSLVWRIMCFWGLVALLHSSSLVDLLAI